MDKYKILLADDQPQNLRCLFEALASENYQIYSAPNGAVAVELALKYIPDAIVMDWDMPVTNGIEALKQIREKPETKIIPVIMATGKMTSVENLKMALDAGANDYIRKPFDTIEVVARVKSMIRLNLEYKKNIELHKQVADCEIAYLKDELEINTSALTAAKLRLIENGQNVSQLLNDLQELRNYVPDEGDGIITKIISHCTFSNSIVNWTEFETLFKKVNPSFCTELHNAFPDLTPNERKLCALIKLNLGTKEIAAITSRKIDTVKKAKLRLKGKLALESMESLYFIIQEIN